MVLGQTTQLITLLNVLTIIYFEKIILVLNQIIIIFYKLYYVKHSGKLLNNKVVRKR
jgi:hypothetical protein